MVNRYFILINRYFSTISKKDDVELDLEDEHILHYKVRMYPKKKLETTVMITGPGIINQILLDLVDENN